MNTSPPNQYFYHSFPSHPSGDEMEKGLRILKSMSESGLLLNPEIMPLTEPLSDGTWSPSVSNIQKRACFTLIEPSELLKHSVLYGHFALEFDVDTMLQLGAIPAFYYPNPKNDIGLEATAISLLCRIGEIQQLLDRLIKFEEQIRNSPNKNQVLALKNNISGEAEDIEDVRGICNSYFFGSEKNCRDDLKGLIFGALGHNFAAQFVAALDLEIFHLLISTFLFPLFVRLPVLRLSLWNWGRHSVKGEIRGLMYKISI